MIERNCLFLSGESGLTMKVVFRRDNWMHTCSASQLILDENKLHRKLFPREHLKAVVFYADMVDKDIEVQNLLAIKRANIPCWPNVDMLIRLLDRHQVLRECVHAGFVKHDICQATFYDMHKCHLKFPFVLKCGNTHRGQNKFLIESEHSWAVKTPWTGIATMEPFFIGKSVRALVIGSKTFGIELRNDQSWIKNSAGAELLNVTLPDKVVKHANDCARYFNLDVAGVDYIIDADNNFYFLEINQFPGLANISVEASEHIEAFLEEKLIQLENLCHVK